MSRFDVQPQALNVPADQCDRAAAELSAAAQVLARVAAPDTGSLPGTALADELLRRATEQSLALASQATYDAAALRQAAARYCVAELTAAGGPCG